MRTPKKEIERSITKKRNIPTPKKGSFTGQIGHHKKGDHMDFWETLNYLMKSRGYTVGAVPGSDDDVFVLNDFFDHPEMARPFVFDGYKYFWVNDWLLCVQFPRHGKKLAVKKLLELYT